MSTRTQTDTPRVVVYSVGATASDGPFAIPFTFGDTNEVGVYVDGVAQPNHTVSQASLYGTTGNTVTLDVAVQNAVVSIVSETGATRGLSSTFSTAELSVEIDRVFALFQELSQRGFYLGVFDEAYSAGGKRIEGIGDPVNDNDAATKSWSETAVSTSVSQAAASAAAASSSAQDAATASTTAKDLMNGLLNFDALALVNAEKMN